MKILFVCTGNTCRSVMAHQMLKKMLADKNLKEPQWEVRSCGVAVWTDMLIPPIVLEVLESHGIPRFHYRPTPIDQKLVDWADLILVMTWGHLNGIQTNYPQAKQKTYRLKEFAGLEKPWDIPDPIAQDETIYRACLEEIQKGLKGVWEKCIPN
ncbi:MAG: low molecular weight protein arginine phosphatase [Elusimicrobia bacterium]|nr:low molecular weight protein arginine phosphatase [Elusimicrobiota bacterium]